MPRKTFADFAGRARNTNRRMKRTKPRLNLLMHPEMEPLEVRITPAISIWSGAVDNLWTTPGNWDVMPTAGDDLVFPADALSFTTVDTFTAGTSFGSIKVDSSGYAFFGNSLSLTNGITTTYASGFSSISADMTLDNGALSVLTGGELKFMGSIGGAAGLTLDGGGTLSMEGLTVNNYTGTTTINAGTLVVGKTGVTAIPGNVVVGDGTGIDILRLAASDQIDDAADVTIMPGAAFEFDNFSEAIHGLTMTGATIDTGSGTLTLGGDLTTNQSSDQATISGNLDLLAGNHTFSIADPILSQTPDLLISAPISGAGGFTKTGTGHLRLTGNNTYAGVTDIQTGVVSINNTDGLGSTAGGTLVASGAELDLINVATLAEPLSIAGTGINGSPIGTETGSTINLSGTVTLTGATTLVVDTGSTLSITGDLDDFGGSYGLTKTGAGTLFLNGNNSSFDGNIDLVAGTLAATSSSALGSIVGGTHLSSGATLELYGNNYGAEVLSLVGSGVGGTGAIRNIGGPSAFSGAVTLIGETVVSVGAGSLDLSGVIDDGSNAYGLIKNGAGTLTLSGNAPNTYSGLTTINDGTLTLSKVGGSALAGALLIGDGINTVLVQETQSNQINGNDVTTNASATLDLNGQSDIAGLLTLNGGSITTGVGTLTLNGNIFAAGSSTTSTISGNVDLGGATRLVDVADGDVLDISALVSGTGAGLTKSGAGSLLLSGANTFDGAVDIQVGTVSASNDTALGSGAVGLSPGAALNLSGGITVSNTITLRGSGINGTGAIRAMNGVNTITAPITLAVGSSIGVEGGAVLTISSAIGESGGAQGLSKLGAGTLELSGTNSYTGETTVNSGTLLVNGSIGTTGYINVNSGATIGGSGALNGLTALAGSTVAPGNSPGILSTTGGATFASTSNFNVEINGTTVGTQYDQLDVTGPVDLGGATLNVTLGYTPTIGDVYTILSNDAADTITGIFVGLAEGTKFNVGNVELQISYIGGSGNDVELTVTGITFTWTGLGADDNWSTPANWGGAVPTPGSDLVFPNGGARPTNNNDLAAGTAFHSISVQGAGYDLNGNDIDLEAGFKVGAFSSVNMNIVVTLTNVQDFDVAATGQLNYYGYITGNFGINKTGAGTLALTNNYVDNSYTGATTVLDGVLLLNSDHVVIPGDLVVGDGIGAGEVVQYFLSNQIADSSSVTLNEGASLDFNGQSDLFQNLTMQGATVTVSGGTIGILNNITVLATTNNVISTIQGPGSLDLASNIVTFSVDDDADLDVELRVTANVLDGGITKTGTGVLALSGVNAYDGVTTVNSGVLQVESDSALGTTVGATVATTGGSVYFSGVGLNVAENFTLAGFGTGNGVLRGTSGDATLTGDIDYAGTSIAVGSDAASLLTLNGVIDNGHSAYAVVVMSAPTGRVVLGGNNTFGGQVLVVGGILGAANDNAFGDPASAVDVTLQDGTSLELAGGVVIPATKTLQLQGSPATGSNKVNNVSGDNTVQGFINLTANTTFDVAIGASLTLNGLIDDVANPFELTKAGMGTLVVSAANSTYNGAVTVAAGTLNLLGSFGVSNGLTVENGATLTGVGSVTAINGQGGTIAPGDSIGILSTGDISLTTGTSLVFGIDGTTVGTQYDQLVSTTGVVDLDSDTLGGATLSISLGFLPSIGDAFVILDNQGVGAIAGTFLGLAEGATFDSGPATFTISYVGGSGNDIVLTVTALTFTWDGGGGDNNWSTAANWGGDIAPMAGADLVFPASASRKTNANDFAANTAFHSITFAASGYNILGNAVNLADGIKGTLTSGNSNFSPGIVLIGTGAFDIAAGGRISLGSTISGNYGFTKTGAGELVLFNFANNTYTGTAAFSGGRVYLNAQGGAIAVPHDLVIGDNLGHAGDVAFSQSNQISDSGTVTVNEGSLLDLGSLTDTIATLAMQGSTVLIGPGGSLVITGGISTGVTSNNVVSSIFGLGVLDLSGATVNIDIADDGDLAVDARIDVLIQDGGINKLGGGVLALSGTNTYAGATTVSVGVIQVESSDALGSTAGATIVVGGSALYFSGVGLVSSEPLTLDGTGPGGVGVLKAVSGDVSLDGSVTMANNIQVGADNGATLAINGVIDDSGLAFNLSVYSGQTGRVVLGGNNTFDGIVFVQTGYIRADNDNALGDPNTAANIFIQDTATLELGNGVTIPATKTLRLQGNGADSGIEAKLIGVSGASAYSGAIEFGGNTEFKALSGATLTIGGAITETGGAKNFFKSGAGIVKLMATESYTGGTYINGGTLLVDGSIASTSSVQVGNSSTIGGSGLIGNVSVNSGGTLAPGNSPGILNSGNASFLAGSSFVAEINGTTVGTQYDQLNVIGTVNLASPTLVVSLGASLPAGSTYTIINNDGLDAITGTFNGLSEGATFTIGNQSFIISYIGGDGNDIVLTALVRIDTWTGLGGDNNWTTAANWLANIAPIAGDQLVFPLGASRSSSVNDFAVGTGFDSIVIVAAGYDFNGNAILLENGIEASYGSGTSAILFDMTLTADQAFTVASGGILIHSGAIGGAFAINKDGGGTLVLMGANAYLGGTNVNAGTLAVGVNNTVLGGGLVTVNTGGLLDISGSVTLANAFKNASSGTGFRSSSGSNIISGAFDAYENVTFDVDGGSSLLILGSITESNPNRSLTKTGIGTLQLASSNSYGGGTDLQAGTLTVFDAQATGTVGAVFVASGSTFCQSVATYNLPSGGLYLGDNGGIATYLVDSPQAYTVNGGIVLTGPASFVIASTGSLEVTGLISGASTLNLSGSSNGTLILSGISGYTGGTSVDGGTLLVTGDITSSSGLLVTGGTLTGNGSVPAVIATGGTVWPGYSLGIMSSASLNLGGGAVYHASLDGPLPGVGHNQLVSNEAVTLGGALEASLGAYVPTLGDVLRIIDNRGALPVSGTFDGLAEGDVITVGGYDFQISYVGGTDNDVTLTCVAKTTTTVGSNVVSSVFGQSVTFTAIVSANHATATGLVVFLDNGVPLPLGVVALSTVLGQQVATYTTSTLGLGDHDITAEYLGDWFILPSSGSLPGNPFVVSPAPTTTQVSSNDPTTTYGDQLTFTALVTMNAPVVGVASGLVTFLDGALVLGTVSLNGLGIATFTTTSLGASGTPHSITAYFTPDSIEQAASDSGLTPYLQTVNKAQLSVTAANQSRVYGDANPTLTATYSGFVNGETLATSDVTGSPDLLTPASSISPVLGSPYAIFAVMGTLESNNYSFTMIDGSLDVTPAPLTVTADNQSREYGDANPTLTASFSGFKNGETLATSDVTGSPSLSTLASPISPVIGNPYAINVGEGTLSSGNYSFNYVNGALNVTPATLGVLANAKTRVYGDANPTFTATYFGFKNGETLGTSDVTGSPDLSTLATPSSPVNGNPYEINAGLGTLASGNYSFELIDGTLWIDQAPLWVTADNQGRVYGDANPTLTATFSGFKNGETLATSDVTGSPSLITFATPTSPVLGSPYAIFAGSGTLESGNYSFNYADGELSLSKAPLLVTADSASRAFGQPNPTFTASYSGFKNDETLATSDVTGSPDLTTTAVLLSPVSGSPYVIAAADGSLASDNYSFSYANGQLTIDRASTSSQVQTNPIESSRFGQNVSVTAYVMTEGAGTPTGTVSLWDGPTLIATLPLDGSAEATFNIANLSVGVHSLSFIYSGDSDFDPSISNSAPMTVTAASTTTSIDASTLTPVFGQTVTLTSQVVAVAPGAGTPDGLVQFLLDGVTVIGMALLDQSGIATLSYSSFSVGAHTIDAIFLGSENFATSGSDPLAINTTQAGVTGTVATSLNPSTYGQSYSFTASFTATNPGSGTPDGGMVAFFDGALLLGTSVLVNGQASLSAPLMSVGGHSITAMFSGNEDFLGATTPILVQAINAGPVTVDVQALGTTVFGQSATFIATVTPTFDSPSPSGVVSFWDGPTLLGQSNLDVNGVASFSFSTLSVGSHSIQAQYAGSTSYLPGNDIVSQQVDKASTANTVASSQPNSVFGSSVTLTAQVVVVSPGAGMPSGTVSFWDGETLLGISGVSNTGQASLPVAQFSVGSHTITSTYGGNGSFLTSTSSSIVQVVAKATATIGVTSSVAAGSVFGQNVVFTASLSGPVTPTGQVTFLDGSTALGTVTLVDGQAQLSSSSLSVGTHSITVSYAGDADFAASTSQAISQDVNKAGVTTGVVASVASPVSGQLVTYTATVSATAPGAGQPGGTISFLDGSTFLGTANVVNGQAQLSTSSLSVGSHAITATYNGNGNFNTGSASTSTTVAKSASTLLVTSSAPTAVFGQVITYTITTYSYTPGVGVPTGTVTLFDGSTAIGTGTLTNGIAQIQMTATGADATHTLTATYGGNANFTGNTSPAINQVINKAETITYLAISPAKQNGVAGYLLSFGVGTQAPGGGVPTGQVVLYARGKPYRTLTLVNGLASLFLSKSTAASLGSNFAAKYMGDTGHNQSVSPIIGLKGSPIIAARRPMKAFHKR